MKFRAFLKLVNKKESSIRTLSGDEALEAVKRNGDALRYVKEQTPEICIEAVKADSYALSYVKEQTPEICIEAVKRNGDALRYVDKRVFEVGSRS